MPLNLTNAVQTAQQLLAYTAEAPNFSDKVDVIFVAEMIEKISKFAEKYKEVSQIKSYRVCSEYVFSLSVQRKSVKRLTDLWSASLT